MPDLRHRVGQLLTLVLVTVVVIMLVGNFLGQPVFLSFVKTGSMAPTLEPGDGFIAVPSAVTGEIEQGDVIVFQAETLHGGGLTTHRVVGETSQGFITKGDANPTTDQSGGEPPVHQSQIKAVALQVGGDVVVIPKLGLLVVGMQTLMSEFQRTLAVTLGTRKLLGTQGIAYLLVGIGAAAYAGSVISEKTESRSVERSTRRNVEAINSTLWIGILTLVLISLVTASMVVPGGQQEYSFVSSETDAEGVGVIKTNSTESFEYQVPSTGFIPTVVYLEPTTDRLSVTPTQLYVGVSETRTAIVTLAAPPATGVYRQSFVEHRYIAVVPRSTIAMLYDIHPWLPILFIDLLFAVGFVAIAFALVGYGPLRTRER